MTSADTTPVPRYPQLLRLDGKLIIVLGAGQGIGRQVSHALAQVGASLVCVDHLEHAAQAIASEVGGVAFQADVRLRPDMEQVFEFASSRPGQPYGVVDIVGRAFLAPIDQIDDETYQQQLDVVFRHAWLAVQLGTRWLASAGEGSIVLVGSLSGEVALPNQALYGAQKAALHHLARCAAVENGSKGVRINTVAPGPTRTPRLMELMGDRWPELEESIPLRRAADASDVAAAVLYLTSPLAKNVSGQTILVDGASVATIARSATPLPAPAPNGAAVEGKRI